MPGHPDPRLNLALTLERAGRVDEALDEYHAALEVYPNHIHTLQALTRCRLRHDTASADDPDLAAHLRDISLRGDTPQWRTWAARQLAMRDDSRSIR